MKKFLVLMLVLGMVSLANAAITDLSMSTTYDGSVLEAGDTFTIDIYVSSMYMFGLQNHNMALIVSDASAGSISGGTAAAAVGAQDFIQIWDDMLSPGWAEDAGVAMVFAVVDGMYMQNTVVFDDIMFECLGKSDVTISWVTGVLDASDQYVVGEVLAELQVAQIPEPMTLALLGLGGLFLRRRK